MIQTENKQLEDFILKYGNPDFDYIETNRELITVKNEILEDTIILDLPTEQALYELNQMIDKIILVSDYIGNCTVNQINIKAIL